MEMDVQILVYCNKNGNVFGRHQNAINFVEMEDGMKENNAIIRLFYPR
jgi:hypothetical protein